MHQELQTDWCDIEPTACHVSSCRPTGMTVVRYISVLQLLPKHRLSTDCFEYVVHLLQIPQHRHIVTDSSGSNPELVDYEI